MNERFDDKDFDGLMLKGIVNLTDKDNALEKYPFLKRYPAFNIEHKDYNKILKYIAFAYDKNTPLHIISDVQARKNNAAKLAGIQLKSDLFNNVVVMPDDDMVQMILWYIRMHKDLDYAEYIISYESYWNQQQKLYQDSVGKGEKTKDFLANSKELRERIDVLRMTIFHGDKSKTLIEALDTMVEEELLLSPEHIAKMLKKGKDEVREYLES